MKKRRYLARRAALAGVVTPLLIGGFPGRADAYSFGLEPWSQMVGAANNATKCAGLTTNQLTVMMAAASWRETVGGSTTATPAPMTLGRADPDLDLYSFSTSSTERRVFWHAGVGLFQLDILGAALNMAAWERVYVPSAAAVTAQEMASRYCGASGSSAQKRVAAWQPWLACNSGACETIFSNVYVSGTDSWVNVTKDSSVNAYGGMIRKDCKSTPASTLIFDCYRIDPALAQGHLDSWTGNPEGAAGQGTPTPLTKSMINYKTSANSKREFWYKSYSGYTRDIAKVVGSGVNPRNVNGWQSPFSTCTNFGSWVCGA